jgi:hypothetical protein
MSKPEQPIADFHHPEVEWTAPEADTTWEPDRVPFSELRPGGGVVTQVYPEQEAEAG